MPNRIKTAVVLWSLTALFALLTGFFLTNSLARPVRHDPIALVGTNVLDPATARRSYVDLVQLKEDLSDYECYTCHERGKAPPLRFDTNQNIIVAKEHSDIVMGHGSHNRNNNCFNCHNETNLERLQTRDGRELRFADSPQLCGSCHGPTYRDWEAGVHGRTSGYWNRQMGEHTRVVCASCHNPHAPRFPGRPPAPGPHLLHSVAQAVAHSGGNP